MFSQGKTLIVGRRGGQAGRQECRGPRDSLDAFRKRHIQRVLGRLGYDVDRAAQTLEISIEELWRWMRKLEIHVSGGNGCEGRTGS